MGRPTVKKRMRTSSPISRRARAAGHARKEPERADVAHARDRKGCARLQSPRQSSCTLGHEVLAAFIAIGRTPSCTHSASAVHPASNLPGMQGARKYALYALIHPANAPSTIAASAGAGARRFCNEIDNALYRRRRASFRKWSCHRSLQSSLPSS